MASGDYVGKSKDMLRNAFPCSSPHSCQKLLQLASIGKTTVVWNQPIYGAFHHFKMCIYSSILLVQFVLCLGECQHPWDNICLIQTADVVDERDYSLPVPFIGIWDMELFGGYNFIVTIRHPTYHSHQYSIWQRWEDTSCMWVSVLSQIHHRSLFPLLSMVSLLQIVVWTWLQIISIHSCRIHSA